MHIAYLTPEYPHHAVKRSAGIGTSIKNLATALVQKGHEISLFIYGQQEDAVFIESGIQFHLIKQQNYKLGGFYFHRKYLQNYINKHSKGIDLIEVADWTGITAFMRLTIPHVIRLHGSDTYFCHLENRPQKKKNFLFENWALQKATAITSVSAFTAQTTKELFGLKNEIKVIHNLIDLADFKPNSHIQSPPYILNFGSVIRKKGVIALAQAFNMLAAQQPDLHLKYLGKDVKDALTGKMTSDLILDKINVAFQDRISFISQVPYQEVNSFINKATVICLPSYAEAFPMTWLEAMALEKPLVTSDIGWAKELMIHNYTGATINPTDTTTFTMALKNMIENPKFAIECGKNARKHLETHFSKEQMVQQNIDFYRIVKSV